MSESDKSELNDDNNNDVNPDLHEEWIKEAVKKINASEDSRVKEVFLANHLWLVN